MNTQNQNNAEEVLTDVQETITTLHNSGMLAKSEEEARLLKAFRMLNGMNKISAVSRIEGMIEAQTYARMTEE